MGPLNAFVNEALHEDTQCYTCSYINLNCVIDDLNEYRRLRNDILAKYYIYTNEQKDLVAQNLYCVKKRTKKPLTCFERGEQEEFEQVFGGVFQAILLQKACPGRGLAR